MSNNQQQHDLDEEGPGSKTMRVAGAKRAPDVSKASTRRQNANMSLRKSKREEMLDSKRRLGDQSTAGNNTGSYTDAPSGNRAHADPMAMANKGNVSGDDMDPWAYHKDTLPHLVPVQLLGTFANFLRSDNPDENMQGTLMIRKMLSVDYNPPTPEIIEEGCVDLFVAQLLRDEMPQLQFESAWALTNIASDDNEFTHLILSTDGAMPNFVRLLGSPNEDCREQAAWAIGNLAGEGAKCRDWCLECGALEPLLLVVTASGQKPTTVRNAAWALSNLCRGKPLPKHEMIEPALPVIIDMLNHQDDEIIIDGAWAISYLTDGANERIQNILDTGCLPRMIELLGATSSKLVIPAIRTIGNVVTGNDRQTQAVLNQGTLQAFHFLLSHPKRTIRKEVCWTVSNITAGNVEQIESVLQANLLAPLMTATRASEFDVKKEAVWAIANVTSGGSPAHIDELVEGGVLQCLCDLLSVYNSKIVTVALEALDNILGVGEHLRTDHMLDTNPYADVIVDFGGYERIEFLQNHNSSDVCNHAQDILEGYFLIEDQPGGGPAVNEDGTGFGVNRWNTNNNGGGGGGQYDMDM